MNCLKQLDNGLIGSPEACNVLSEKKSAKLLVLSDSHGGITTMRYIIMKYGESCDAIIFAGDGAADLITCLEEAYNEEYFMKCIPPVIALVKGNNDAGAYPSKFNPYNDGKKHEYFHIRIPRNIVLNAAGRSIFISHGNEYGVYYSTECIEKEAEACGTDSAVFGHTHCPAEYMHKIYLMNPGSSSCPRNHSKPGFAFLNICGKEIYSVFYKMESSSPFNFTPYNPDIMYY